jgi:hypothetical protein
MILWGTCSSSGSATSGLDPRARSAFAKRVLDMRGILKVRHQPRRLRAVAASVAGRSPAIFTRSTRSEGGEKARGRRGPRSAVAHHRDRRRPCASLGSAWWYDRVARRVELADEGPERLAQLHVDAAVGSSSTMTGGRCTSLQATIAALHAAGACACWRAPCSERGLSAVRRSTGRCRAGRMTDWISSVARREERVEHELLRRCRAPSLAYSADVVL